MTDKSKHKILLVGLDPITQAISMVLGLFGVEAAVLPKRPTERSERINGNSRVFVIYGKDREELYTYLWDCIRLDLKSKGPVMAFGHHSLDPSIDFRDKVFKENLSSHRYFGTPFNIADVIRTLNDLKPIESIKQCVAEYHGFEGLRRIVGHDLKNHLRRNDLDLDRKKDMVCAYLNQLREKLVELGAGSAILKVDRLLKEVQSRGMSRSNVTYILDSIDSILCNKP